MMRKPRPAPVMPDTSRISVSALPPATPTKFTKTASVSAEKVTT